MGTPVSTVATVDRLSPARGMPTGGEYVTIHGTGFTGATAVMFGTIPASSFEVGSDSDIVSYTPAVDTPQVVDVTVTTPGGTTATSPSSKYTYLGLIITGPESPVPPNTPYTYSVTIPGGPTLPTPTWT